MRIFAVGCEYEPIDGWTGVLPAITAPKNYKDTKKIAAYIDNAVEELRMGKAATDPVVGSIVKAVIIDENEKVIHEGGGALAGAGALMALSARKNGIIFGLKLRRMVRLMALDFALNDGEIPTKAQWAVNLDPKFQYNRGLNPHTSQGGFIDPVSVLFGSSDTDLHAVARRTGYADKAPDNALDMATFALKLGGLLGLGG